MDLVEVAPDARPPVCRVMDYGKFMYEQTKKERAAKKTQKQVEIKGIRIRPDTDPYHIGFKVKQARGFLMKGNKVRITCQFRGRERSHPEIARDVMRRIATELKDIATVEQSPNFEGRNMTMLLAPDMTAIAALRKAARKLSQEKGEGPRGPDGELLEETDDLEDEIEDIDEEMDDEDEDEGFDDDDDFEDDDDDDDDDELKGDEKSEATEGVEKSEATEDAEN